MFSFNHARIFAHTDAAIVVRHTTCSTTKFHDKGHKYLTLLIYYLVYKDKKLSVYLLPAHNYYFAVSEHTDARFAQIKAMHAFWHQLVWFRKFITAVPMFDQICKKGSYMRTTLTHSFSPPFCRYVPYNVCMYCSQ